MLAAMALGQMVFRWVGLPRRWNHQPMIILKILETKEEVADIKGISSRSVDKNKFYQDLQVLYEKCPTKDEL
jgi:hypothetical protein